MNTRHLDMGKTILAWDEGLPLGNGDLGCLIWNTPNKLRFSIDKAGIWDCSGPPELQNGFNYDNLQNLIKAKKQRHINKIFDKCYENTTPTKLPTGKIILDLHTDGNIVSNLDLIEAEATLLVNEIKVKSIVHAIDNYGLISINKPNIDLKLENPQFGLKGKKRLFNLKIGIAQSLKNLYYYPAELHEFIENNIKYKYFIQPTTDCYYGIITAMTTINNTTLIAYTVGFGADKSFVDECLTTVKDAINLGYDSAIISHKNWWKDYSHKSTISLPDKQLEHNWYLNNYLLASCSRKSRYPMPLQGVWTADNGNLPPWKGDYHHDLNTQMSYTGYLKSNRLQEGESFIDFLLEKSDVAVQFAKSFYGVDGLCLPSVMDIKGNALGGWAQYALSPTNQLWLCYIMARHYYFTDDTTYLKDKIYPYMEKVGTFIINILKEENGHYKLPLSSSPEINDNSLSAWLKPNSNYDLALMHSFMNNLVQLSTEIGNSTAADIWRNRLQKLEPLAVANNNILMLSSNLALTESHRHLSHCMAIYPLRDMLYADNKPIIDSTIANLEGLGIKFWVGYTFGWIANLYTIQENGEKAAAILKEFFTNYCSPNGFHLNGDFRGVTDCGFKYRHFTLEGNFIALDAINNMLLYSERDGLKLFPAVPDKWQNIEFTDLRGYGGVLISSKLVDGRITYLKLKSSKDITINLQNINLDTAINNKLFLSKGQSVEYNF